MRSIEERFRLAFAPWDIALPPEDVKERRRSKIVDSGWAIWYLFGSDERGGYLDYYASHRMTDDRHVRFREEGPAVRIVWWFPYRALPRRPTTANTRRTTAPAVASPAL
jgi:hypothetical protein